MKKVISVLIITSMILGIFCGCGHKEYKSPGTQARELQTKIMECFEKKDKETLKSFFSKYAKDNYDIDKQIDEAFDFIDSDIVSYDEPFPGACGNWEKKSYGATTDNIKTKNGTKYKIDFGGMISDKDNSNRVGVNSIRICDMSTSYNENKSDRENGILFIGEET